MDDIDLKIIELLKQDGRIPWAEISHLLGLSSPAIAERVHRLEELGVIKGFSVVIDPEKVGCHLTAFIAVTLSTPNNREAFIERVKSLEEVQECHHITGEDDYLLKVRCRGNEGLEGIISSGLKSVPGVLRTNTVVVLRTHKENATPPVLQD